MKYRARKARNRLYVNLSTITAAVAVIAAIAVGVGLAAVPAGAAVVRHPASSSARMKEAVTFIRENDSSLANASNRKIETLVIGMTKNVSEKNSAAARHAVTGAKFLGVSKTGHTLWFNKADVVAWAVASTALIIASLEYMGVEIGVAYDYAHLLLDTLWGASFGHRCAWFTYSSPRSLGTYSC